MKQTLTQEYLRLLCQSLLGLGALMLLPLLGWGRSSLPDGHAYQAATSAPQHRAPAALAAAVYTWSATGTSASWSAADSWTPARSTPAASDVLQFTSAAGAATAVLDFNGSQTISRLVIQNGCTVTFSTAASRTLTISDGSTGADLVLDSGTQLTLYLDNSGSLGSAAQGLTVQLGTGATASIAGRLLLDAYTNNTNTTPLTANLRGSGTNSVEFLSGSVCTTQLNFRGEAFGHSTTLPNSVVFRNGSRYEHFAGSNPFALNQPASIVTFEPASTFYFAPSTSAAPSLGGRTYGNLEYNMPGLTATSSDGGQLTVAGNLILTAGAVNINLTGGVILKGDVLLNGGTLNFAPASATTVQFSGTTAQRIGGTVAGSSPTFGSNATLQVYNAAGLTLGQPASVAGVLQLTSGLLTTTPTNILTLTSTATVADGSDASFVNGPVRRPVGPTTTAVSYVFPVGKGSAYRPLMLLVNTQLSTTNYRAEQFEGSPGGSLANPDASGTNLVRVSQVRYFTLSPYNNDAVPVLTQPTGFTGNVRLSFGSDDQVTNPADKTLVVAKRSDNTQPFSNFGRAGYASTASGGTVTSGTITSFSDLALASINPDRTNNPLPVQLTSFAARRVGSAVLLAWTTASELRSDKFVVERSLDGRAFEPVAQVAAQGSSAQAHDYAARDERAPAGPLYYRLRMVDQDGSLAYSAVATVGGALAELTVNPNPAGAQVGFYTEQALPYLVRSTLGQVVRQGSSQAGGLTQLDLQGLASGVYFLELRADGGRLVRRFVKE